MAYSSIKIKEALDKISDQEYVLPAIQREYVWGTDQIEKLFDSLMRGYPIGSFLFWDIKPPHVEDYQFYGFLRKYHELENHHNPKLSPSNTKTITAILDGQQRLTSLYIGLKGSYTERRKGAKRSNPNAYPEKFLYLNLLGFGQQPDDDSEYQNMKYNFKFLTEEESKNFEGIWFKVADICSVEVMKYTISLGPVIGKLYGEHKSIDILHQCGDMLNKLQQIIMNAEIINYFTEQEQDLDKVLNIFTRVNNQGTPLSYSDLLLSTATALWTEYDAREEIHNLVDKLKERGLNVDSDFVMKSCLMLADIDVKFLVKNFTKKNTELIEGQWLEIKEYLILSATLLQKYGFSSDYIPSYNAILPIAYYLKKNKMNYEHFLNHPSYQKDRDTIIKWLRRVFIKQIFGGGSDGTLTIYRDIIKQSPHSLFPIEDIEKRFKGKRQDISFSKEYIQEILDNASYDNKKTLYSIMTAVFSIPESSIIISIDHLYPKSSFTPKALSQWGFKTQEQQEEVRSLVNHITNLQFLESTANRCKSAQEFQEWKKSQGEDYDSLQMIPKMKSYSPENFLDFCKQRYNCLLEKLQSNI